MTDLTTIQFILLAIASMGIGFSKAGFPGVSMLHVVVFALCFGAKESTGILLPMLVIGDVCAIASFGRRAVWSQIFRLLPPTLIGILSGWAMMDRLDPTAFRWIVGTIILTLAAAQAYRMFGRPVADQSDRRVDASSPRSFPIGAILLAGGLGFLAGMTTMLANAAGPVIAMYLLVVRMPKFELIGTAAWLFLVLNLIKLPLSFQLGLIDTATLRTGAMLSPMIPVGLLAGRWLVHRISQRVFNAVLLAFTAVMAVRLMVG